MGIEGLKPFLKPRCPSAFFKHPMCDFRGKYIAVDAINWWYAKMSVANRLVVLKTNFRMGGVDKDAVTQRFVELAVQSLSLLLGHGIKPVFVFDGPAPIEKSDERKRRSDERKVIQANVDRLYAEIAMCDPLSVNTAKVEELRKILINHFPISEDDINFFKAILTSVGIPCIEATGEAEKLCSMLCVDGKVAAVMSADTDNMAYMCKLMITGIADDKMRNDDGEEYYVFDCIRTDTVINDLGLSTSQFVDVCIMMGCDFNNKQNIPNIGPVRAYNLIREYDRIENIAAIHDVSILKYEDCRRMFTREPSDTLINCASGDSVGRRTRSPMRDGRLIDTAITFEDIVCTTPTVVQCSTDIMRVPGMLDGINRMKRIMRNVQVCPRSGVMDNLNLETLPAPTWSSQPVVTKPKPKSVALLSLPSPSVPKSTLVSPSLPPSYYPTPTAKKTTTLRLPS